MRAGIIAAGWGSRLGGGPKALTRIGDRCLIDIVLERVREAGADSVTCIINEAAVGVREHVSRRWPMLPVEWIVRTTPTSMHSFVAVLEAMAATQDGPCLITTVDSVCAVDAVRTFVERARRTGADLALGVTDLIDDEKPLYAVPRGPAGASVPAAGSTGEPFEVARLSSESGASRFVTSGFYWIHPSWLPEQSYAFEAGFTALRQFLGHLVTRGARCWAVPLPPVIDVDRPEDVAAAQHLLDHLVPHSRKATS